MICLPRKDFPDVGLGVCCMGAAMRGPQSCTCWKPIFDLEQVQPSAELARWLAAGITPVTRKRMCAACAYRPNSPERRGDPTYAGTEEGLDELALADRFWCHVGIRRPIAWRHRNGIVLAGHPGDYDPPIINGVPYRADGTPAELCAGWHARRRALLAAERRADPL